MINVVDIDETRLLLEHLKQIIVNETATGDTSHCQELIDVYSEIFDSCVEIVIKQVEYIAALQNSFNRLSHQFNTSKLLLSSSETKN